jgi:diguanylate cyclase (GGDEF)-like protein
MASEEYPAMSTGAKAYVGGVLAAGLLLSVLTLLRFAPTPTLWVTFAALTVLATSAQIFKAEGPNHVLFYTSPIFFFAGALLLPPFLIVLLVAIPQLIEWVIERRRGSPHLRAWYLQPFNIAMTSITAVSIYWLYAVLTAQTGGGATTASVIVGLIAAISYVCLNHALVGIVLVLARGVSWRDSGMLDPLNFLTELVVVCLGLVVAALWQVNPAFIVPALAPLVLMYRALMIPQLKHQATIDAKTGLVNAAHFKVLFRAELDRAGRFERPLAVIMADLDLLRDINNRHGHLAGDAVLGRIGQIIRKTMREYDISSRFGGEEFALVIPEVAPHVAEELAERLRHAVAETRFPTGTGNTAIGVTMSLGVACFPQDGRTMEELTFAADMAVYEAKTRGRNAVVRAADLPRVRRIRQPEDEVPAAPIGEGARHAPTEIAIAETVRMSRVSETPDENSTLVVLPATDAGSPPTGTIIPDVPAMPFAHAATQASRPSNVDDAQNPESMTSRERMPPPARRAARLFPQPGVAIITISLAVVALIAGLVVRGVALGSEPIGIGFETLALAGAIVLAYQYPIHIRLHLKVQGSTMVYYLIAVLLPLPLAVAAAGLGTLVGELSVRRQRKLQASDIATAVGRWLLLILLGTLVANVPVSDNFALAMPIACALVLAAGDLITLPLILAPMTGERPLRMLRALAKETALPEGVQYLLGFLGVLVAERAGWALALFVVPAALVYQAAKHLNEVQGSTHRLLESLADTVDLRDPYTGGHSRRVTESCGRILREMKLSGPDRDLILSAARVHDIGKIALPDSILHKPGPLTAEERALMQTHPERGAEVLARHKDFVRGVAVVLHHHEAWDGSGYPRGLKGLEIPFGARVIAVADSFDAMTSDRPYRRGMPASKAAAILRQGRAQQWDARVVDAFLAGITNQQETQQFTHLPAIPRVAETISTAVGV